MRWNKLERSDGTGTAYHGVPFKGSDTRYTVDTESGSVRVYMHTGIGASHHFRMLREFSGQTDGIVKHAIDFSTMHHLQTEGEIDA